MTTGQPTRAQIAEAAGFIQAQTSLQPEVAIILGSGLGPLADEVADAAVIPYAGIPHFVQSTVAGHQGELILGALAGQRVCVMKGRLHFYEGYPLPQVTFPVRVLRAIGARLLVITNAAGGLNPDYQVGDLMLLRDHINLVGLAGHNPLMGPNDDSLGPRFPDMSEVYRADLRALAQGVAGELGLRVHQGVYVYVAGPSYETPADLRFLRLVGADAVGMSTVPEVTAARHMGMAVLGVSGITNVPLSAGTGEAPETSHHQVLEASSLLSPRLIRLIRGVLPRLDVEALPL
ncbi:MAG: purine-nucleoside phosphorylase [Chloroflexi bacterium]|nr:purine-nucleoside phosphorylase [Chloroflexota bacterium]